MRQRNDTFNTQHVSAWPTEERPDQWPFDVGPNEEIDYPELLAGFTEIKEPPAPKSKRKDAAPAAEKEDGEQA